MATNEQGQQPSRHEPGVSRKRLLIVEDDPDLSWLLKFLLELEGFDVHAETLGRAALDYASGTRPDLVILDLKLPDIDGYLVCQQLRTLYNPWVVPILMLTCMDKHVDQVRGFTHGATAYLTKTCQTSEIIKTVKLLLQEAR